MAICNKQEIIGVKFTNKIKKAVEKTLNAIPEADALRKIPDYENNVVCLLRGGLNFDVRDALSRAYGNNNHSTTFLITRRSQENGTKKWIAKVQNYKEISLTRKVVFYLGDVIRSGKSLQKALATLEQVMLLEKKAYVEVRKFIVFTIGCKKAEEVLEEFDRRLRQRFPDYEGTTLVYFEGRFNLVEDDSILLSEKNTDLIRKDCLLSPEFYLSQFDELHYPLERCVLYDGGSRAFDIFNFKEEIQTYWTCLLQEAKKGYTLKQALYDRFPAKLAKLTEDGSSEALQKLCIDRLEAIQYHVR